MSTGEVARQDSVVPEHLVAWLFKKWQESAEPATGVAQDFVAFCDRYLRENRPATMGYQGDNFEIQLTSGERIMLAPLARGGDRPNTGEMQPSTFVAVSGKETSDRLAGVRPPEPQQMQQIGGQENKAVQTGFKRYDR